MTSENRSRVRKGNLARLRRAVLISILLALVVLIVFSSVLLLRLRSTFRSALYVKEQSQALWHTLRWQRQELPSLASVRALRLGIERFEQDLRAIQRMTQWFLSAMASQRLLPQISHLGTLLRDGLAAGVDLSTAAWWTALRLESDVENHGRVNTATGVPVTMQADVTASVLRALDENRSRLAQARGKLASADRAMSRLAPRLPSDLSARWKQYSGLAPFALDALLIAPSLLRAEGERNWLLVVQNSDELRATGGFISSVALLRFKGLGLESWRYMNSYDIEAYRAAHPPAPGPLREHMRASILLFRDANWSADFHTSAQVMAALFELDMGDKIDGVVAIDTTFAQMVLSALGPVAIPKYDTTVTAENVLDTVIGYWEEPLGAASIQERDRKFGEWLAHRKDFGKALIESTIYRASKLSVADGARLGAALRDAIRGKHLLVWAVADERLQADLTRLGADGRVRATLADYIMVVDSNVGWNKADRHVKRSLRYSATVDGAIVHAEACVAYTNTATADIGECVHRSRYEDTYEALSQQCDWNYVRILVPNAAQITHVEGAVSAVDVARQGGRPSFGTLLVVPPWETREVCLGYDLPSTILRVEGSRHTYELFVQKQPGTTARQVEVHLQPPVGVEITDAPAPWKRVGPGLLRYQGMPDGDIRLSASWSGPD